VDALLGAVEATEIARALRGSRWLYAATNAAHIFGIALLVGGIIPLQLRFLGLWPGVPRAALARVLSPVAAAGLALAIMAGMLLFSIRARQYAGIGFLQLKLIFVAVGTVSAIILHRTHGLLLESASDTRLTGHAIVSLTCWIGALVCGRLIAFAGG